jgi:ABC-2 type transport system ATP-binding protein
LAQIVVEDLVKTFRIARRRPGLWGAVRGLARREYREVRALDGIGFRIEPGELVGYVGPNGAGKSTTIKILSGILVPDSGRCEVLGQVPWRERADYVSRIGVVFGQRTQLWWDLPVTESFELLSAIYRVPGADYRRQRDELVELLGVSPLLDTPVRQLSLGQRMRCDLVAALLHAPPLVFLDEPTIGLDVSAKAVIRDLVRDTSRRDGSTVLLTSHDTGDMERVCDRVLVIHEGKMLLDRPIAELRKSYIRRKLVTLLTAEEEVRFDLPGVTVTEQAPHRTVLEVDVDETPIEAVVQAALKASRLRDLTVEDPPMEEIVQAIYAEARA